MSSKRPSEVRMALAVAKERNSIATYARAYAANLAGAGLRNESRTVELLAEAIEQGKHDPRFGDVDNRRPI